jgi:predicted ATPase
MEFASVQLFLDRAQAVRPDFRLNKTNAATVAALCHRLEGLPLAIELAAAWVQTLTPAQMLQRLSRRFDLLVSRRTDLPLRHRSLRATLEGSHRLLPPELQQFFARLAVFRGGWTLEAAETVCAEPMALDYLTQLRERSLIQAEESGDTMRFRMLETLREYAEEQIPDEERAPLSRRHAEYFVRMSEQAYPQLEGANQSLWLEKLEAENENLRAALTWTLSAQGDSDLALRLAGTLWRFWFVRGYPLEGRDWLEAALERGGDASETVRAAALHAAGNLASHLGDYKTARDYYEACLALRWRIGDLSGVARTLGNLGNLADFQGNYTEARALYDQSLSLCRQLKDRHGIANALQNLGNIAADQGDYTTARAHYEESLTLFRALGDQQGTANLLSNLGAIAHEQQDLARAAALFEESLVLLRALGAKRSLAIALNNLGYVALDHQNYPRANALHQESLGLFRDLGDKEGIAYALEGLAIRAQAESKMERAVCLLAAAETLRQAIGAPLPSPLRHRCDRALEDARNILNPETFARSQAQGHSMTLEQAIAYALGGIDGQMNAMIFE